MFNNHYKLYGKIKPIEWININNLQEIKLTRVEMTTKLKEKNIENVVFASEMRNSDVFFSLFLSFLLNTKDNIAYI